MTNGRFGKVEEKEMDETKERFNEIDEATSDETTVSFVPQALLTDGEGKSATLSRSFASASWKSLYRVAGPASVMLTLV